jgi:hypothetical protein
MKLIIFFCLVLLTLSLLACKSQKPAVSYAQKSDTLISEKISLVDVTDVKIGFDFPIGATMVIDGVEITRIDSSRYLKKSTEKTIRETETRTEFVATKTVDKSKIKITDKDVDKSRTVQKQVDRSKEVQKTTIKKKNGLPWWLYVVVAIAAVFLIRKFMNHKPFG